MKHREPRSARFVLSVQSFYYLLTGLWPLVHIQSFMAVTGPKTDLWLVKTVGALICCSALSLLTYLFRREFSIGGATLGVSCAVALLTIDLFFSLAGVIGRIYLVDGLVQLFVVCLWCVALFSRR